MQLEIASKQYQYVDVVITKRISQEPFNGMQERIENIPVTEAVENTVHKEPFVEVCVMNIDNFFNL